MKCVYQYWVIKNERGEYQADGVEWSPVTDEESGEWTPHRRNAHRYLTKEEAFKARAPLRERVFRVSSPALVELIRAFKGAFPLRG